MKTNLQFSPHQMIYFRLDGKREGEGKFVRYVSTDGFIVKLTKPCKEHPAGTELIIAKDLII